MSGTAMYVRIRRMPPKMWGYFWGQRPQKEHISPPIWASLVDRRSSSVGVVFGSLARVVRLAFVRGFSFLRSVRNKLHFQSPGDLCQHELISKKKVACNDTPFCKINGFLTVASAHLHQRPCLLRQSIVLTQTLRWTCQPLLGV